MIESTPTLPLPDGEYVLTAKARRSGRFNKMLMYAKSGGKKHQCAIDANAANWTAITISGFTVCDGKAEIGFEADGSPNAECLIDDIELRRKQTHGLTVCKTRHYPLLSVIRRRSRNKQVLITL